MVYSFSVIASLCLPGSAIADLCMLGVVLLPWLNRELAVTASSAFLANAAILAAGLWCLYRGLRCARREMRGYAMSLRRLATVPLMAVVASLLALMGPVDRPHNVVLWVMAFACGLTVGVVRGYFVIVQVDRALRLVRTRRAEDGYGAMRLVALFAALEVLAIGLRRDTLWHPLLAAATAACAAFLAGRFVFIWYRARAESHMELVGAVRALPDLLRLERSTHTWSSKTARLTPGYIPIVPPSWRKPDEVAAASVALDGDVIAPDYSARRARQMQRDARGRFMPASSRDDVSTASPRFADTYVSSAGDA